MADRPRLVATDLDGTLLRSDGTVSAATSQVLARIQSGGVIVVLVTARPLRWMTPLWSLTGDRGFAVLSNGALVWDVEHSRSVEIRGLEPGLGLALCDRIRTAAPQAHFALEFLGGASGEPGYQPAAADAGMVDRVTGSLREIWQEPAFKLLVQDETSDPEAFRAAVLDAVGTDAVATWTMDGLMEISAPGVTKAEGLRSVAERLGVAAHEVVAFGDMPNDVPMLRWAGASYAVANADPSVLAAASGVAPSNDDDGVAHTLATIFGLGSVQ